MENISFIVTQRIKLENFESQIDYKKSEEKTEDSKATKNYQLIPTLSQMTKIEQPGKKPKQTQIKAINK